MLRTMYDVQLDAKQHGSHFFDRAAMRFFSSRLCGDVFHHPDGRVFFVTSERFVPSSGPSPAYRRKYTVRSYVEGSGNVNEESGFQAYASRSGAIAAARRMADAR